MIDTLTNTLAPLVRGTVGFEGLLNALSALDTQTDPGLPPYNIHKCGDHAWKIEIAVAGFKESELQVDAQEGHLRVAGHKNENRSESNHTYLHHGIAFRSFERRFNLAENVRVLAAQLENGLLTVNLEREIPEEMKPRRIDIQVN